MNKKLLSLCGLAAFAGMASAQSLHSTDVVFPQSTQLHTYIQQWNGGAGTLTVNGNTWEDQEFFTSRVKPRERVTATGANTRDFGSKAGRRTMWWVPIGDPAYQALPNAKFNSEAFSMWSYLDVYGNWTAPYGWVTGAMADIAHKNGVSVSGQASIPNAGLSGDWLTCMTTMGSNWGSESGAETVGKFLLYHGCDGLSYNSEFSASSTIISNLMALHNGLFKYMKGKNPAFENIWYDGTTESGGISFDSALSGKTNIYKAASIFSNYNWNSVSKLSGAVSLANGVTDPTGTARGPWWNYAGMNQQGGEPRSGTNYPLLPDYDWSLGWWGAHSYNMFWEGRGSYGTNDLAIQNGYLKVIEQFFGNGQRNPAIHNTIVTNRNHRPNDTFFGCVEFINERSTLNHALGTEPFYTFFNLGNGQFFNWKGERVSNEEWYSIAVQDYLPTWRFWTTPSWLQTTINEGDSKLKVGFTYEDAFFGGSCLKVEGTADTEYLHLFKTQMSGLGNRIVTIRYKLLEGTGDVRLLLTSVNTPGTESSNATLKKLQLFTTDDCDAIENASYKEGADGWQTATFTISAVMGNNTNMPGGLGAIGLEFKNANGLKILLGELSIKPKTATATPNAPVIRSAKVLRNAYTGVDGKLIWTMDNDIARKAGTPKYNSDVNTSMFKVYSREEGESEAHFLGVTTSWAAIAFRAPNTDDSKKVQFGVSAVSMDTDSESAITWSDLMPKGDYTTTDEIAIDKIIIKPNEAFRVYYVDPKHPNVDWAIKDASGNTIATNNGVEISLPDGIANWGGYDLVVNGKTYPYYVQITEEKVGALPAVYTISNENGELQSEGSAVTIKITDKPTLSYTGREADGSLSRALNLNSLYVGAKIGDLGIQARESISIAGWFKFSAIPDATWNFMNISNKGATWPQNTWGWAWNHGGSNGQVWCTFRGAASDSSAPGELHYTFPQTKLEAGVWTHIAWICDYTDAGFRCQLYINGIKQPSKVFSYAVGNVATTPRQCGAGELGWNVLENGEKEGKMDGDTYIDNQNYPIAASDWAYFGGAAHGGKAIDGIVDDFQVWNKAMTAEDVKSSMGGYAAGATLPSGLLCLWDFEDDCDSDFYFKSRGSKADVNACSHTIVSNGNEGSGTQTPVEPTYDQGCPFIDGTGYPIVTVANWSDATDRKTVFDKVASRAANEGEAGAAKVTFKHVGDHTITLTLENKYGSDSKEFPVYTVEEATAIDGIVADEAGLNTYTIDRTLFLEFAEAGEYTIYVYNTAGMIVGQEVLNAAAGQNARIDLGAAGMYLVKAVKNGQELRTIKVLSK